MATMVKRRRTSSKSGGRARRPHSQRFALDDNDGADPPDRKTSPADRNTAPAIPVAAVPADVLDDAVILDDPPVEAESDVKDEREPGCVYLLEEAGGRASYVGWTVNLARRLRQHNGEITGGAKYTTRGGPWRFAATVTGEGGWWTRTQALQFEWAWKHCRSRRAAAQRTRARRSRGGSIGTGDFSFSGHSAVTRRLNDLFRLLDSRRRWTRSSSEYSALVGQTVTVRLAEPFAADGVRQRFTASRLWNPTVRSLE